MAFQIVGARKPGGLQNPHEAISFYQWRDDTHPIPVLTDRVKVVGWVENDKIPAYVLDGNAKIWCYVRKSANGIKFLQTQTDNRWTNNLINLPQV